MSTIIHIFLFQFHYDLILFQWKRRNRILFLQISISLWSYSILNGIPFIGYDCTVTLEFQFHYDLILFLTNHQDGDGLGLISISLWSYSINLLNLLVMLFFQNFNFIMILFYYFLVLLCLVYYFYFNFIMILFYSEI